MATPDPNYDLLSVINMLAPGVVLQQAVLDGVHAAWAANGYRPLTAPQVIAVTGPLPAPLTTLKRMDA